MRNKIFKYFTNKFDLILVNFSNYEVDGFILSTDSENIGELLINNKRKE